MKPRRSASVFIGDQELKDLWCAPTQLPSGTFCCAVAHAAVYLASDEAAFVRGTVLDVDGGRVGVAVIANTASIV